MAGSNRSTITSILVADLRTAATNEELSSTCCGVAAVS
jgi:hypothetical protein